MEEKLRQKPSNCIKIVLFGPESSGKTTLSRNLAAHYNCEWIPEYAREYLQHKWEKEQSICAPEDLLPIAEGQMRLENAASKNADRLLICDTDLLETKVYGEAYYDHWCPPELEIAALANTYDLYLLTYIDIPWEADDLRDRPEQREEMFLQFKEALVTYKRPFVLLKGTLAERMAIATEHINKLLS
ncbi:AAA family ATPase [Flavimarina sp. Hel_I_48]|uniref:AAA family ATPase n=1 Tax=Flavimarina sp. Hel_I_48 TaxID=1392488 RepID=UPI0004DEE38A|nr:ATP-binding protein [Flavimarina sp. Hel_I_48]